jgi:hypothetical protein
MVGQYMPEQQNVTIEDEKPQKKVQQNSEGIRCGNENAFAKQYTML